MKQRKLLLADLISDSSFTRWTTGEADPVEMKRWNQWVEYSEENRDLAIQAQKIITGITFDVPEVSHQNADWKKIQTEILKKGKAAGKLRSQPPGFHGQKAGKSRSSQAEPQYGEKAGAFTGRQSDVFSRQHTARIHHLKHGHLKHGRTKSLPRYLKTAAVFLILGIAGLLTFTLLNPARSGYTEQLSESVQRVQTDYSEKKIISLPDGSGIVLAAGSSLSYKKDWQQESTLRVILEKGEAYFSIRPDERGDTTAPRFEVETEDGVTAVMGTRFSVTTYGEGTRVVLEQGAVHVSPLKASPGRDPLEVVLAPGEMAQWSKADPSVTRTAVNPQVYTSWISDYLYFDDTPLSHLIERIERTYGVDVVVEDPELLDLKLSGALDFYGLDELAGAVSEVLGFHMIHHENNRVILTR